MRQLRGAVDQVGTFLRATANPVVLTTETKGGRDWLFSAQIQVYALALTLAFVTTLLGAAAITAEREDAVIGRLARGLVSLGRLVIEKIAFATIVATIVGAVLALVFGVIVAAGGSTRRRAVVAPAAARAGPRCWRRRRSRRSACCSGRSAATPAPRCCSRSSSRCRSRCSASSPARPGSRAGSATLFPFGHTADLFSGVLYDASPLARRSRRGAAWLVSLTTAFGLLARLGARRLVV